jgi:uncharacterized membrane-anchored protein YhcB (DUF1043 family)
MLEFIFAVIILVVGALVGYIVSRIVDEWDGED